MGDFERRLNLAELVATYNEATNPAALRTDEEHRVERMRARTALGSIRRSYVEGVDYRELSNGALWAMREA